jgi:hypothetical protein
MNIHHFRKVFPGFMCALLLPAGGLHGLDSRTTPIEVNLIMDGSQAMKNAGNEALAWVSGFLVDGLLREGDRITIWNTAGEAKIIYSETLSGPEGKETIMKTLRGLNFQGNRADFSTALRAAAQRAAASRYGITYTLLICGSSSSLSPLLLGSEASLLRYSRIEEFPGWRALVVALDLNVRVRQAAAAYFSGG